MVKDEDDQDPSFNYQGCTVQDGACIHPEYYTTVSNALPRNYAELKIDLSDTE